MNKLSVTIITKNEEKNIGNCLSSVDWVDEVIVLDSGSEDHTLEVCTLYPNVKIHRTHWLGFGKTKKKAVDIASHDWILSLDADEEITLELKKRIQRILENPQADGYSIKRKSYYLGKKINHCGWDRDYPLRLFNRTKGNFNDAIIHESVKIDGKKEKIHEVILHYTYPTILSHIKKIGHYSDLGAKKQQVNKGSIGKAVWRGIFKFIKMYFLQRGFWDGKIGLVLSINSAYGVFLKYLKLWELTINDR
jgi:glycosyltransferase involved in cell wall biosynthesis